MKHPPHSSHFLLQGVYGWKLSPAVKSYRSYEKWDQPPEPEPFQVRLETIRARIPVLQIARRQVVIMGCLTFLQRLTQVVQLQVEQADSAEGKAELSKLGLLL